MASPLNGLGNPILFRDSSLPPAIFKTGLPFDAPNTLSFDFAAAVDHYSQGLPLSPEGRICIGGGPVDHFGAGAIGFDTDNKLCVSDGPATHFANGVPFDDDGFVVVEANP